MFMFVMGLIIGTLVGAFVIGIFSGRAYEKGYKDAILENKVTK